MSEFVKLRGHRQCKACWNLARRGWLKANPDKLRKYREQANRCHREQMNRSKVAAVAAYGGRCSCCGESNILFLTFDHVFNNGAEHRRRDRSATKLAQWLCKNRFPAGFQVLCFNCNIGRHLNGGVCPHVKVITNAASN